MLYVLQALLGHGIGRERMGNILPSFLYVYKSKISSILAPDTWSGICMCEYMHVWMYVYMYVECFSSINSMLFHFV